MVIAGQGVDQGTSTGAFATLLDIAPTIFEWAGTAYPSTFDSHKVYPLKGKPLVDANFGEVLVTCEKITWLLKEGEKWLKPESRSTSSMMFYKKARVEYVPVRILLLAHAPPNSK